ncbi:GTPase [Caldalkalibacillus thermarum]|uniref:dynamin family protein n=1 Tax=Caldalkalibacillus thermarum TaxID=296745 RepID=UPI00166396AC|nr:dynamin family protein [Caldalkalibacillus thermarum]GGK12554.1 GTPase [Caldalkalibacillus thermarum]
MSTVNLQTPLTRPGDKAVQRLMEQLEQTGDKQTVDKLESYIHKWQEQTLHIGFCGLFSAGKSTMINTLLGEPLLPSNPIPTSANVVSIRYGEPKAMIHFTSGSEQTLALDQLEKWKAYCTNGDEVEWVDIFYPHPLLAKGVTLLDTPGIDSTDPRHQQATEAALHLADVVIFVADYHYVQSEVNFSFLRRLKEQGKYLYLVINQIDKHRGSARTLGEYLSKLYSGLREWRMEVDGLLCTSLKQTDHPFNMLKQLKQLLEKMGQHKVFLLAKHFKHGLNTLLDQHRSYLLEEQSEQRQRIASQLDQLYQTLGDQGAARYQAYREALEEPKHLVQYLEEATQEILKNAIITPYVTIQLVREMIDCYQDDFKVGWLFAAKKTEQERRRRVEAFYADLTERVQAQIEWHLKDMIRKSCAQYHIDDQQLLTQLLNWELNVPREWITSLIRTGGVARDYVYVYLDELKQKIHGLYRQQMEEVAKQLKHYLEKDRATKFETQKVQIELFEAIMAAEEKLLQLDGEIQGRMEQYRQIVSAINIPHFSKEEEAAITVQLTVKAVPDGLNNTAMDHSTQEGRSPVQHDSSSSSAQTQASAPADDLSGARWPEHQFASLAACYEQGARILAQVPLLGNMVQEWREKGQRLKQRRFRIFLFGAFSAGKSSFANALLGKSILPVSPHPTTAAINYILPPTDEHPAGTFVVHMKSREQVEHEVAICLERLSLKHLDDMTLTLRQVHHIDPSSLRPSLKPYYAFLRAFAKGWETVKEDLSKVFAVGHDQYTRYVADEGLACFVRDIKGHLDSPLTRLGLEIIDTPGADSIYTRHTDVTFNFLKQADVIVYLTYYNHAFSRVDRHFLDQLGRVKEQFALDKMFFVINAADLASSEGELLEVTKHVESHLLQSGIRFPRLYPLSSLRALEGRDAGFERFKEAFLSFLQHELAEGVKTQVEADLKHGLHVLKELKTEVERTEQTKEEKMKVLHRLGDKWSGRLAKATYESCLVELRKEIAEQLYYVNQRLFFNFKRHVDDAFHPGVLSEPAGIKQKLEQCLDELLFSLSCQVKDELKAVTLRIENVTIRLLERERDQWLARLKQDGLIVNLERPEHDFTSPSVPEELVGLDKKRLTQVFKHFKKPKQFFEQGGKEKLREELETALKEVVACHLEQVKTLFNAHYEQQWQQAEQGLTTRLENALQFVIKGRLAAINGELTPTQMEALLQEYHILLGEAVLGLNLP